MVLETMLLLEDSRTFEFAKSIAKELSSDQWMSTQTTAYSLLAMGKLMLKNGGKSIQVDYNFKGKKQTVNTDKTILKQTYKFPKDQIPFN